MASDAGLRLVVSDRSVHDSLALPDVEPVLADEADALAGGIEQQGDADDVAYVIYTSGSTGRPKGVLVPHRTVTNLLHSVRLEPGMTASNSVLSVTTLSFDIAVSELILPLTVGARIVVANRDQAMDGSHLRSLIESEGVDFIDATPSSWRLLLAAGWRGSQALKAICTGEPLPPDLGRDILPLVGELWNGYGPTETTVWSSFHRVRAVDGPVPIGRPIANTAIHVVDARFRPLPLGVIGELFIGGAGVTLGYLGRDDLTAERFLPDPCSTEPGARWYRTGDLGRWRSDGVLECLGRIDHQVKLRGYRIELGEIEAGLLTHPDLQRVLVVTHEDPPGDVRLVAYAVLREGAAFDLAAMQSHLRKTLPDYMVPQHLVVLAAIPLLPNGKVDRQALPRPESAAGGASKSRVAPRTPIEQQVLTAMEDVLKLPGLGVHDDFFALGGHSLLAARLAARLNKELAINLPMRTIFETPSAEGLAHAAQAAQQRGEPLRSAIAHRPALREAPLTVMQERIRFMEELYPGRVVYNTPSAHRLTGPLQHAAFEQALRQMLQRQPGLRTTIVRGPEGLVQRVVDDLDYRLPFDDLSDIPQAAREAELMRRLQAVINVPIDLYQAPLFRAGLYRLRADQHVFLFMPHHIIWDGWSFDLLYREMAALYPAAVQQVPARLAAVPVSYLDYAHWHARWMTSDECRAQVRFWKARYARVGMLRALPTDRPRGAGMSGVGAVEWVHVDKALTERLRDVARGHDATLNMLVMAVYAAMLSEALGTSSLVLGVPVRGRLNSEVESVMGFFNNLLPTPIDIDRSLSMRAWTGAVKREFLDSFANQEVPFERLASEPEIARHANKAGLYQSLFSFQDARERERHWGELSHASVLVMQKGATEDFGLWLMEVPAGLEGGINYNADLFDASTARIFRERLVALLQRVAGSPDTGVAALLAEQGVDKASFDAWVQARRSWAGVPAPVRRAVPAPDSSGAAAEERLASIWARLLGIDAAHITAHDNFFDIGGNSLLAMQAVAACESELGLRIDPRRYVHEPLGPLARGTTLPGANVRQDELARVWAELLGVDRSHIQAGDNFFDLGGSSLLAMRAVAEAERQLGLKVDPRRYVYESLQQLSVPAPVPDDASAVTVPVASDQARPPSGLFTRLLGRLGRRL
jgi:amino acid adenylation domain-containing protein